MKMETLPENILKRMSPEDRRATGQQTAAEAQVTCDLRSERELHRLIEQDLLRRQSAGEPIWWVHSRMDKATTTAKGVPDFVVIRWGIVTAIECKVGNNKLTDEQQAERTKLEWAGANYFLVRTFEDYQKATKS